MIYTFKTLPQLVQHLHSLCQLSSSIVPSILPIKDFETDLPEIRKDCLLIKRLSKKSTRPRSYRLYIAFRTTGFESSMILHHFKSRVNAFHTSLISCYCITFVDGYYNLEQISFN